MLYYQPFSTTIRKRLNSYATGQHEELNSIGTPQKATHLKTLVIVNNVGKTYALVDSGANGNYMSRKFAGRFQIPRKKKETRYLLTVADRKEIKVEEETLPIRMTTQQHHEDIAFDIVELATQDIYLGMPWLRQHNPTVN